MEIQRQCRSYYWKRVQVLHGGKEVWNETVTESLWAGLHRHLRQKCGWFWPGWCTEDHRQHVLLKKVLSTLDNIGTELKQSIGYTGNTGSKGLLRKDLLHTKSAYTRCWVNQKVLMERQDVVLSRIRYLRMVRELRDGGLHRWNLRS